MGRYRDITQGAYIKKHVCKIITQSVLTLARRCLFIAPTPPGPLRILKTQISGQN